MNETKKTVPARSAALWLACAAAWPSILMWNANLVRLIWVALCFRGHRRAVALCARAAALLLPKKSQGLPRLVRTTEKMRHGGRPRGGRRACVISDIGGGIDMNFYEQVYELVQRASRRGSAPSYGQLALMLGNPRASPGGGLRAMRACRTPGRALPPGGACRRLRHTGRGVWPRRPAGDAGGRGGALAAADRGRVGAGRLPVGRCLTGFACHLRTGVISFSGILRNLQETKPA